jgi:hypothetical protein
MADHPVKGFFDRFKAGIAWRKAQQPPGFLHGMIRRAQDVFVGHVRIGLRHILSEFFKRLEYNVGFPAKPGCNFPGITTKCHGARGDSVEGLSVACASGPDGRSENACHIHGMNMVDGLQAEIRDRNRLSMDQCCKYFWILIPCGLMGGCPGPTM